MSEYQENLKEREARTFLIDLVNKANEAFLRDNRFLDHLENGEVDQETWRHFAVQRYLAAIPFESLLEACKNGAEDTKNTELARVISLNIKDEIGLGEDEKIHPELAHTTWRKDFYTALGISEDELNHALPAPGTLKYKTILNNIIEESDPLVMAGAILALEGTIPREFTKMKKGRDATFTDIFVEHNTDSQETKTRKAQARLYLDDHIVHDAKSHYPELLNALVHIATNRENRLRLQSGIEAVIKAKNDFYNEWK